MKDIVIEEAKQNVIISITGIKKVTFNPFNVLFIHDCISILVFR